MLSISMDTICVERMKRILQISFQNEFPPDNLKYFKFLVKMPYLQKKNKMHGEKYAKDISPLIFINQKKG